MDVIRTLKLVTVTHTDNCRHAFFDSISIKTGIKILIRPYTKKSKRKKSNSSHLVESKNDEVRWSCLIAHQCFTAGQILSMAFASYQAFFFTFSERVLPRSATWKSTPFKIAV